MWTWGTFPLKNSYKLHYTFLPTILFVSTSNESDPSLNESEEAVDVRAPSMSVAITDDVVLYSNDNTTMTLPFWNSVTDTS